MSIAFMALLVSFLFSGIESGDIVKLGRQLILKALSRVTRQDGPIRIASTTPVESH